MRSIRLVTVTSMALSNGNLGSVLSAAASGGLLAFTGRMAMLGTGFAVNVLLARLLLPSELGSYYLVQSIAAAGGVAAVCGMDQALVRLIAESRASGREGRARDAITKALVFSAAGCAVFGGAILLGVGRWLAASVFEEPMIGQVAHLAAIWLVIIAFRRLMADGFRGFHNIGLASLFGGALGGALTALGLSLVFMVQGRCDLSEALWVTIGASGLSLGIGYALFLGTKVASLGSGGALHSKELLRLGIPLWLIYLMSFVMTQSDLWIVAGFRSSEEVAIYGAAARLVQLIVLPIAVVDVALAPLIARMWRQTRQQDLEKVLRTAATLAGIPALLMLVACAVASKSLLEAVFGEYFGGGASILVLLSIGQLAVVLTGPCGSALMMMGHQRTMMNITLTCGVGVVVGSIAVARDWGATGVASVMSGGLITQNLTMLLAAKMKTGVWTHVGVRPVAEAFKEWRGR